MSTCPYSQHVSAYHDGELSNGLLQDVENHLPQCAACSAELEQFRRLSAVLSAAPVPRLSAQAKENLHALAPSIGEAAYLRIAKWTTALAASVLLAASAWALLSQRGAQPQVEAQANWHQVALNPPQSADPQTDLRLPDYVETALATPLASHP